VQSLPCSVAAPSPTAYAPFVSLAEQLSSTPTLAGRMHQSPCTSLITQPSALACISQDGSGASRVLLQEGGGVIHPPIPHKPAGVA